MSHEDCECSESLQWDCANTSQLCWLTLATNAVPMDVQSVRSTENAWDAAICGCNLKCRNAPEASSLKSKISLEGHDVRRLHV